MPESRNPAVGAYVACVTLAGTAVLVAHAADLTTTRPFGPRPWVFALFAALMVLGELRPLKWLTGREDLEITASWTFSLGLVFIAPPGTALLTVAAVSCAADLANRKAVHRVAFNMAQITLSLALAHQVLCIAGAADELWRPEGPGARWLVAATVSGLVAVLANGFLTAVVFSLSQQIALWVVVRDTLRADGVMDLLLVALAPVLTGVGVRSFVLLPLLLVVVVGVYQSAKVGLAHRHEATHDLLTGLPNRRFFYEQAKLTLDVARLRGRTPAVLLVDLDGFKEINDRLGHAVGDLTLREVATRLLRHRRSTDLVARLGGDEFVILLGGDIDPESAERVALAILHGLSEPLEVDGVPVAVGGSVGMALYPHHGEDVDTLLGHADAAMYRAKSGRLGLQTYDDSRDRHGPTRLGLLGELREAIADDQLELVYQPQIELASGRVCAVEALVRWRHPTRGLLLPDAFIPAVEQTELVDELTERVLRLAARQAATWRGEGLDLRVAINTSARNLIQIRFPRLVREVLDECGLPADRLEFEVTENTVTNDPVRTETVLAELRALGVGLSIDDFGTGYSSLAHLRSLPIDRIKVDRSFVRGVLANRGDLVIVRCIVDLAANLGLETVAEGVEDAATLDLLRSLGCQLAQGFHIARPVPPADVPAIVAARVPVSAVPRSEVTP